MTSRVIVVLTIASLLTGCNVGPKYNRPGVAVPPVYRADASNPPGPQSLADEKWFELFKDKELQALIHAAFAGNFDLREAVARELEARANYGIVRSNQFPTIVGSVDVNFQRNSRDGAFTLPEPLKRDRVFSDVLLELLTFEVDVWGKLRNATASARAEMLASDETRKAVITTVVSDVATAYFTLRELDTELDIAKRTLASRQDSLRIVQARFNRGVSNQLELRQAEQLVYSAAETIPLDEKLIEQQENLISFLIGKNPQPIPRGLSLMDQPLAPAVPPGLPSALIQRRPDILAAEQNLISANAQIGVARAAYFPQITLTGALGFQSNQLESLFSPSRNVWEFIPLATQPIFTAGRIKSNVRFTQAQKQFFVVDYEKTIEEAFREVSDALIAYQKTKEVRVQSELLVATLKDRTRLAYMRFYGGVSNLLEALDADRDYFEAELANAQVIRDELLSVVQLYKALGGGWQQ